MNLAVEQRRFNCEKCHASDQQEEGADPDEHTNLTTDIRVPGTIFFNCACLGSGEHSRV